MLSVVVLTYNSDPEKIKLTLLSILMQKNIDPEIIVSDDGSAENHFDDIEKLFEEMDFRNYIMLSSDTNNGTVKNVCRAMGKCSGDYVKLIGPGDFFCDDHVLCEWYGFMKTNRYAVSFGDAVFYSLKDDGIAIHDAAHQPQKMEPYLNDNFKMKKILYLIYGDYISGSALMFERDCLERYVTLLADKVRLAEDLAVRLIIGDDIDIKYYKKTVIFYEYGSGVSTSGDDKWYMFFRKEVQAVNTILHERIKHDWFGIRCRICDRISERFRNKYIVLGTRYLLYPSLLRYRHSAVCKTVTENVDVSFYSEICRKRNEL